MKQVLITLAVLVAVMVGYYWLNSRGIVKKNVETVILEKQIYFQATDKMVTNEEATLPLMAKYSNGVIVSYAVDFSYDLAMIKIIGVEVNKDIFDKKAEVKIDENFGKVTIVAENSKERNKLVSGEVKLATIKLKGLKKGTTMIYLSRRPETGILESGKVVEGNFQMPNFKVNFL